MKTNIAINGYCGRMGTAIYEESANFKNLKITVGCDVEEKILNKKTDGVILTSDLTSSKDLFDVVIDFTLPIPSIETIYNCVTINKPIVIGTTGYNNEQLNNIKDASQTIPILLAPNMSIGVNVSLSALSMIARSLKNYKVKIEEVQHKNKIDSPSGTAIKMAHQYKKFKCEVCEKWMRSDVLGRHMKIHKDLLTLPSDEMEEELKARHARKLARQDKEEKRQKVIATASTLNVSVPPELQGCSFNEEEEELSLHQRLLDNKKTLFRKT